MAVKDVLGRFGENVAAAHLEGEGLVLVARNWRCREGEIDIVAVDGDVLVFCEVKTRSGLRFGSPAEAVSPVKLRRLKVLAARWLQESPRVWIDLRFDVVSVLRTPSGLVVDHLRAVL
ncbi:MAG: putative endonuclease [Frankiales bacterium]|nr:putative endonuclease [Frankiales bacterium]MDX6207850.1 putative endonuclease [Frankiales bacterium]MDX6212917.1 putative endonuclease [Frankiales bacterium]MDX6221887.1 putative endonuclease [Frankiales bacterium]